MKELTLVIRIEDEEGQFYYNDQCKLIQTDGFIYGKLEENDWMIGIQQDEKNDIYLINLFIDFPIDPRTWSLYADSSLHLQGYLGSKESSSYKTYVGKLQDLEENEYFIFCSTVGETTYKKSSDQKEILDFMATVEDNIEICEELLLKYGDLDD